MPRTLAMVIDLNLGNNHKLIERKMHGIEWDLIPSKSTCKTQRMLHAKLWETIQPSVDLHVKCQMVENDPKHINMVGNHAKQVNKVDIAPKLGHDSTLM